MYGAQVLLSEEHLTMDVTMSIFQRILCSRTESVMVSSRDVQRRES